MKKKLAVYANGWNRQAMFAAIEGIKEYGKKEDFDVFVFVCHAAYTGYNDLNRGELNIYDLGDIRDFDGVIVFSGMLNSLETAEEICHRAHENHVPVVSIGIEFEDIPFVGMDNDAGMRQVVTHLVEEHNVKRVVFLGGTEDHVDSIARLRVTKEVLQEHGLDLDPSDIFYANWGYEQSMETADKLVDSEEGLPDAIVCANDYMALAVGMELAKKGCRLPEDVAVTGFDHVTEGEIFYPALTTVSQNYEKIGYECCRIIFEGDADKKVDGQALRVRIPTEMVLAESCGCLGNKFYDELHKEYCRHSYQSTVETGLLDQREWNLQSQFTALTNGYESLKHSLRYTYLHNQQFEGGNFHFILNSRYVDNSMTMESEICADGWDDEMTVMVSLKDGQYQECEHVSRRVLVPGYQGTDEGQRLYFFLPLHTSQYDYGYLVFGEDSPLVKGDKLYSYMEKLQENLRSFRVNLRLDDANRKLKQIYDKDAMTGLFNRFGYEDKALPLFQHCKEEQSVMMVMFVDINYMKKINDVYGHLHGDNAIRLVAEAIKDSLREDWIAVRFGGDEFLIIAPDCDGFTAESVKQTILDYLEEKNVDGTRPYRISVSCGYVLTNPKKDTDLQGYIREADTMMYEIKRLVHAKDAK